MVSTRERARAAMAALDRRNPNLDDFVGLNWNSWIDKANILTSEGSNVEGCKYGKKHTETMTLRKEDMHIYGHCPAHDDFYLVVCSHCGQVVKPQAFEKHCERRHGPLTKLYNQFQFSIVAPQQRPRSGRLPSILSSAREKQDSRHQEAADPSAALAVPQYRPAKAQKDLVSLPSVETFPQDTPLPPPYSSTPRPRVPPWHMGPLPPAGPSSSSSSTSPSEKAPLQKPVSGQSDDAHSPPGGPRTYSRSYKKVYKKACDLDRHCGVLDPVRKKLCTRQLMCNIHSVHQRRKVVGRSKAFDQLVMEQRTGSAGRDLEQLPVSRESHTPKNTLQYPEVPEETSAGQRSKHNLSSNCPILSRSRESSDSGPEEDGDSAVVLELQPPYPFNQSLLSSEDSEGEEQEEARDLPATPRHPKPLGLCTFGSRNLGCSIFTFDRRLHHLRFALSAMVEHHISAHLWKKIPQVSTSLRSRHATTTATGSSVRTGARASSLIGSSGLGPSSSGQSETKSSQHNPPSTKQTSSTLSLAGLGPGRPRNPVGRPSKARMRELELMPAASPAQKAIKLSHSGEEQSSKHIRDYPHHEKGQPHTPARTRPSPSSQGPINGTFSLGKKPCPPQPPQPSERASPSLGLGKRSPYPAPHRPPHPPLRSRGRPPGVHRRVVGYDHRGLAQKRKTGASSPPISPSLSRTPKSHCLPSQSHSSLFSWKGESIGSVLARGLEKSMDP